MQNNHLQSRLTEFAADILTNDAQAAGRKRLADELAQMENDLKKKMDKGVSPSEADKIQVVRTAIQASRNILDQVWESAYN